MKKLHQDIEKYVRLMRMLTFWFGEDEYLDKSIFGGFLKVYLKIKWAIATGIFVATSICLYFHDNFGLYDSTISFFPASFMNAIFATIATCYGKKHLSLIISISDHYNSYSEPSMVGVRNKLNKLLFKWGKIIIVTQALILILYTLLPLLVEIIFHHCFDALESHSFVPYPFSPAFNFLNLRSVWNTKYYMLTVANILALTEMWTLFYGFFCSYGYLTIFIISEIKTLKQAINSVDSRLSEIEQEAKIKKIVEWHCSILKLNKKMKAYFGLPCAIITLIASVQLSLSSFSIATNSNITVMIAHGLGSSLIAVTTFFINVLGQYIENESEGIYEALCHWPWYNWSPRLRKTVNIMIRQGQTSLNIDYHGMAKMNNDNLMQILQTSYSYFTLLYSMASR